MEDALHLIGGLRKIVEKTADEFEPGVFDMTNVERALDEWAAIERIACAAKLRAASRAEEVGLDADGAVAQSSGVTSGQARKQTRVRRKLANKPRTKDAFDKGNLSPTQAAAIGDAADADPSAEQSLLDLAASGASMPDLLNECERIKRNALDRDGSLAARQKQAREFHSWTDGMGMTCFRGRLEPLQGAKFLAELDRRADALFRAQVRAKGIVDTPEQRRADALMELVGAGAGRRGRGPSCSCTSPSQRPNAATPSPTRNARPPRAGRYRWARSTKHCWIRTPRCKRSCSTRSTCDRLARTSGTYPLDYATRCPRADCVVRCPRAARPRVCSVITKTISRKAARRSSSTSDGSAGTTTI